MGLSVSRSCSWCLGFGRSGFTVFIVVVYCFGCVLCLVELVELG